MFDISREKMSIDCPECNAKVEVTLQQVAEQRTVVCRCGQKIKLEDKNGSAKKSIKDINKGFDDLMKSF